MRKVIGAAALVGVLGAIALVANSASSASRPPGVSAEDWIAVNDSLGLVVVTPNGMTLGASPPVMLGDPTVLLLPLRPPISGYFMARRGKAWVRVVVVEPAKGPGDAG